MTNWKQSAKLANIISNIGGLVGFLMVVGGVYALSIHPITQFRLLMGVILLIFGVNFIQLSYLQHLRGRIDALEKRLQKFETNIL
jgi:uncharacterized membrane protein